MNGHCACGEPIVDYSSSQCRCGLFIGWQNFRKADSERLDLATRYNAASTDLAARGLSHLQVRLEDIARDSRPVITMRCEDCDDLLRDRKYQNYNIKLDIGDRLISSEITHSDRLKVNETVYPGYGRSLQYALLSPDGYGLGNYGEIAVSWLVTPDYLGGRATLLEENEFTFFDKHGLGAVGAVVPSGYRATWADRKQLVVAKLAPEITSATGIGDLPGLILAPGTNKMQDRFVEVVIYGDQGIDGRDIVQVALMKPITEPLRHLRWQIVVETCNQRGIRVV